MSNRDNAVSASFRSKGYNSRYSQDNQIKKNNPELTKFILSQNKYNMYNDYFAAA